MTLIVHTAHITYAGYDRIDITRKSGVSPGIEFAPSWRLLSPILAARRRGESLEPLWPAYVEQYTAEMRASYRGRYPAWSWLLEQHEITLVCYCTDAARCHRTVLAEILAKLGGEIRGERAPVTPRLPRGHRPAE